MEVTRRAVLAGLAAGAVTGRRRKRVAAAAGLAGGEGAAMPVTITSTGIFNQDASAAAGVAAGTAAGRGIQAGRGTLVGAYIDEAQYSGGLTHAQAITHWQSNSGRTMGAERFYVGKNNMPATVNATISAALNAGRIMCLSYKPSYFGAPTPLGGGTSQASLDSNVNTYMTALASAVSSAGLGPGDCPIDLWQEPIQSGITGAGGNAASTDFIAMVQHYSPIIRSYGFPVGFCTSAADVFNTSENTYYPGDSYVDFCATDYYFPQYGTSSPPVHPLGSGTSKDAAHPADSASPPKPFGIYEFNSSTDPAQGCTQTQATNFWHYLRDYMQGRLSSGKQCMPLLQFNTDLNNPNPRSSPVTVADGVIDPNGGGTATEYRNALIANMIDTLAVVT